MPKKNNAPARVAECHPDKKHTAHGLCKQCYDREYARKNRAHMNAKASAWAAENKQRRLEIRRKYLYGIEPEVVRARMNAQEGLCKICREGPAEHLDHDHKTGVARGLLCGPCNRGLGCFRDDPERLKSAVFYLDLWSSRI